MALGCAVTGEKVVPRGLSPLSREKEVIRGKGTPNPLKAVNKDYTLEGERNAKLNGREFRGGDSHFIERTTSNVVKWRDWWRKGRGNATTSLRRIAGSAGTAR